MDNWPTGIKFAEGSLGHTMFIGNELHQKPSNNPIRRAFELSEKTKDWDQHCADPSTIIYGVWGTDFFNEVSYGSCNVRAKDGWTKWVGNPILDHSYNTPKVSNHELEYLMDALLLKDPLPDNTTKIIYPSPTTLLFPGKNIQAKGLGKNLKWTIRKNQQTGPVLGAGEGVNYEFDVPDELNHDDKLILTLQGDGGRVSATYDVKIQGLLGKYYRENFSKYYDSAKIDRKDYSWLNGSPHTFERIDSQINFKWANSSPDKLIKNDSSFSVAWFGYIKPEFSESFNLYLKSSNGARLYIDNALLIDDWIEHPLHEIFEKISFESGKHYPIRIEYYSESGSSDLVVSWSSESLGKEIIPLSNLLVSH